MIDWIVKELSARLLASFGSTIRALILAGGALLVNYGITLSPSLLERITGWTMIVLVTVQQLLAKDGKKKAEIKE